jgi:MoaA/NifB/PqqE/SkfB family radical SAM enzyme
MYRLSDIRVIHLETTTKCQARCPQCGRIDYFNNKINSYIKDRNGKPASLDEVSLLDFIKWFPPKFISQLNHVYMCGTLGEPIFAKDCLKIFAYLRTFNRNIKLTLHTNGSFRPKEWWKKLAKLNVKVVFGIDGLSDTHSLYRVNTNWKTIIENASSFIQSGGNAEWQMLVFKHNEHQIQKCKKLSKSLGFKSFQARHTSQFTIENMKSPSINPKGEITHYLEPSSVSLKEIQRQKSLNDMDRGQTVIKCPVKANKEIYVSANGNLLPCCWMLSSTVFNFDEMIDYEKKINMYPNLHKQTLKEIFDSLYFHKIENTWKNDPLLSCFNECSKKVHQDFVEWSS